MSTRVPRKKRVPRKPSKPSKPSIPAKQKDRNHQDILKESLGLLIDELLPVAVESYTETQKQGAAYAVTNIISEIRGTIQQLDSAVNADTILEAINREVANVLRMSITRMAGHITLVKEGLILKVKDSATRRDMDLLVDGILKEYESNVTEVINNIDIRISSALRNVIKKGPKTQGVAKR